MSYLIQKTFQREKESNASLKKKLEKENKSTKSSNQQQPMEIKVNRYNYF